MARLVRNDGGGKKSDADRRKPARRAVDRPVRDHDAPKLSLDEALGQVYWRRHNKGGALTAEDIADLRIDKDEARKRLDEIKGVDPKRCHVTMIHKEILGLILA
jgi:hypothetical protein